MLYPQECTPSPILLIKIEDKATYYKVHADIFWFSSLQSQLYSLLADYICYYCKSI